VRLADTDKDHVRSCPSPLLVHTDDLVPHTKSSITKAAKDSQKIFYVLLDLFIYLRVQGRLELTGERGEVAQVDHALRPLGVVHLVTRQVIVVRDGSGDSGTPELIVSDTPVP
jgi:ABC-type molybdate transport system ATPase subunit